MSRGDEVITHLINAWIRGDKDAGDELFHCIYGRLRGMAGRLFQQEGGYRTIQPTALVNEFVADVADKHHLDFANRRAFYAYAAKAMRRILMQAARKRKAPIHGGDLNRISESESMLEHLLESLSDPDELLAIDRAIEKLSATDNEAVELIELRYFAGLQIEELVKHLGISRAKVNRDLLFARRWLAAELGGDREDKNRRRSNVVGG